MGRMRLIKSMISRLGDPAIPVPDPGTFIMGSDATALWSPTSVVRSGGSTINWDFSGGYVNNVTIDDPTVDMSTNTGICDIVATQAAFVTTLRVNGEQLTYLDVSNCSTLDWLDAQVNPNLTIVNFGASNTLLREITVSSTQAAGSDFSVLTALEILNVVNASGGVNLDFSSNTSLVELYIGGIDSDVETVNLSNLSNLEQFSVSTPDGITSLDLTDCTALRILTYFNTSLTSIDLTNNNNLEEIYFGGGSLTAITVTNMPNLNTLRADSCPITTLDISSNPLLTFLMTHNTNLSASETDNVVIDIEAHGTSNGTLWIRPNRTTASDTAFTALQGRGWTINETGS